jgi:hypothetical protein
VPELDDGADDPLLRPELDELELDEPEVDEPGLVDPELDDPELTFDAPEFSVPDDEPADDDPDGEVPEDDVPLLCEPGSARVMTPAAATLARPTVAVVLWIRLRPRARAATARMALSRFGVFMTCSLLPASRNLLCTSSQPPMSRMAINRPPGPGTSRSPYSTYRRHLITQDHEDGLTGYTHIRAAGIGSDQRRDRPAPWPPRRQDGGNLVWVVFRTY